MLSVTVSVALLALPKNQIYTHLNVLQCLEKGGGASKLFWKYARKIRSNLHLFSEEFDVLKYWRRALYNPLFFSF